MKIDAAVSASISKHPHDGRQEAHCSQCRHHKHPTLYCFHDAAINLIRDSKHGDRAVVPFRRVVLVDQALCMTIWAHAQLHHAPPEWSKQFNQLGLPPL
jgi:hypothetical protein